MTMKPGKQFDEPPAQLVWDLPVRLFHWLLATLVAAAWLSAEQEWLRTAVYTNGRGQAQVEKVDLKRRWS